MARPRLGESETKRLQMVITEDELEAIDRWRFRSHIESRSEAIRRLCRIALLVDSGLEQITDASMEIAEASSLHRSKLADAARQAQERSKIRGEPIDASIASELSDDASYASELAEAADILRIMILALWNSTGPLTEEKDWKLAQSQAAEIMAEHNRVLRDIDEQRERYEENRRLLIVLTAMSTREREAYERLPEAEKDAFLERAIAHVKAKEEAEADDQ